jgi:nucleotide-binding universal stress UspA family protein
VAQQPGSSLKNNLLKQLDTADIVVMGSMELSNFEKDVHLGSMAQAVARRS